MQVDDAHLIERKQSGQEILAGEFLLVNRDIVSLPDGNVATREYIVHPGAVMIIPLITDEHGNTKIVLERQFRYAVGSVMIEFPAGKRDSGEDLWACARRELYEETGYTATEWARAGVLHTAIAYSTEFIEIWFARQLTAGQRKLDQGEFLDVITVNVDELMEWCLHGKVTDAKTLAGALWLQNVISGALKLNWQKLV
jgi:ADP-ribose pyrophosphatase